ncbi:MAG: zinc metallopeptidase [Clostridiales bacterium]|nr:zinc metallopeptidase [Clostridiales bacterium]MBR5975928.1 zinc metallopeptidase [Clostridiales bacterium]
MFWDIMSQYGLIISIIMMVISLIISANCKATFSRYSKKMAANGLTGADAAQRILSAYGVNDVTIQHISGNLTDNYNPKDKTLNLSDSVYASSSIAAIGVAAHECGHAIQHNVGFLPNKIRSALVPGANIGSRFGPYVAIIGLSMMAYLDSSASEGSLGETIFFVGIVMFSLAVLFYLVTLPVELDASRRALQIMRKDGLLQGAELSGARKVLSAAAMTYIAAAASAIVTLLRLMSYGKRRR